MIIHYFCISEACFLLVLANIFAHDQPVLVADMACCGSYDNLPKYRSQSIIVERSSSDDVHMCAAQSAVDAECYSLSAYCCVLYSLLWMPSAIR